MAGGCIVQFTVILLCRLLLGFPCSCGMRAVIAAGDSRCSAARGSRGGRAHETASTSLRCSAGPRGTRGLRAPLLRRTRMTVMVNSKMRSKPAAAADIVKENRNAKEITSGYIGLALALGLGEAVQKVDADALFGSIDHSIGPLLPYTSTVYFLALSLWTQYTGSWRALGETRTSDIRLRDSLLAPVLASASLFSLYLLIKVGFDPFKYINGYFFLVGSLALFENSRKFALSAVQVAAPGYELPERLRWRIRVPEFLLTDETEEFLETSVIDLVCVSLALGLASVALLDTHLSQFTINNLIALFIAMDVMRLIGFRSYATGAILLVGLLCYDVFWVFGSPSVVGSNVMMEVATQSGPVGPSRLLFPIATKVTTSRFPFSLLVRHRVHLSRLTTRNAHALVTRSGGPECVSQSVSM